MDLIRFIDNKVDEQKVLNEATELEMNKEILTQYFNMFKILSNTFTMMSKEGNINADGVISKFLRNLEVTVQKTKDKVKATEKSAENITFDSSSKKALGEMANSLEKLSDRIKRDLLPSFDVEPEKEVTDEENPFGD